MKKTRLLCTFLASLVLCLPIAAAGEPLVFGDAKDTPNVASSGYPRFARLQSGAMLISNEGAVRISIDRGKNWTYYNAAEHGKKTVISPTSTAHTLTLANWQPFVLPDGTVLMAYRAHTADYTAKAGAEFYTSIRVMTGNKSGTAYKDEQILLEDVCDGHFYGFWEPFMIRIDEDTVALYYADDLHVDNAAYQQRINFITYSISEQKWDTTVRTAVDGVARGSRDGMPAVTQLIDGSFAMVIETFDYHKRFGKYNSPFVTSIVRSEDGIHWGEPIPVAAPTDLQAGHSCAAPFIATLPDGRVVITYMTGEAYVGPNVGTSGSYNSAFGMIVSDAAVTFLTPLTPTKGGAAPGFTRLESPFGSVANRFQIWNSVYCSAGELYVAGCSGYNGPNGGRSGHSALVRRADVSGIALAADFDGDGDVRYADVLQCIRWLDGEAFGADARALPCREDVHTLPDALAAVRSVAEAVRTMGK